MSRVEIKCNSISEQCVCRGHSAKYNILIKGIYSSPQAEIPLCDFCFKELKKVLKNE